MTKLIFASIFTLSLLSGTAMSSGIPAKPADPNAIVLTSTNMVAINGPVNNDSISEAIAKLADLLLKRNGAPYPLYIVLNTPGGSVHAGLRLYEFLKPYKNVHTITLNSMSMGAVLVEMIGGERLITETGTLMFHNIKVGVDSMGLGELEAQIKYTRTIEKMVKDKIKNRTGISADELDKKMADEWFMGADEAVESHMADRIVTVKCSKELLKDKKSQEVMIAPFLPAITVEISGCPLL